MNAERLHALAIQLQQEFETTNVSELLGQLTSSLQSQVTDPAQATYQQQVSSTRQQLDAVLADAPSNSYAPSLRQSVIDLGIGHLIGENLRGRIEEIFSRNQITPSIAAEEIAALAGEVAQLEATIKSLVEDLARLRIGAETLGPGEFEVGVLIPRAEVDNHLAELGNEFENVNDILLPFIEVTTGSRPDIEIRSISSSEFHLFLESYGATAACVAFAIERLTKFYKLILDIKLARQALKAGGISDETVASIEQETNEVMDDRIAGLADEIIERFGTEQVKQDEGRTNELRGFLRGSLRATASRLERGYDIDVRAGELEPPVPQETPGEDGEEGEEGEATVDPDAQAAFERDSRYVEEIKRAQAERVPIDTAGEPILSLVEATSATDEDDEDPPAV